MNTTNMNLFQYRATVAVMAELSYKNIVEGNNFTIYKNAKGYAIRHHKFGKISQHSRALPAASYFVELEGPALLSKINKNQDLTEDPQIPICLGTAEFLPVHP